MASVLKHLYCAVSQTSAVLSRARWGIFLYLYMALVSTVFNLLLLLLYTATSEDIQGKESLSLETMPEYVVDSVCAYL